MKAGVCLSNLRGKSRGSLGRLLVRWSRRHTLLYGLGWEIHSLLTLPSECVSLNRPGFEDLIHPRHRRGGGDVGIGFIDFQGLWEGGKTAPSFSGLSTNRHFHGLL